MRGTAWRVMLEVDGRPVSVDLIVEQQGPYAAAYAQAMAVHLGHFRDDVTVKVTDTILIDPLTEIRAFI